MDSSGSCDILGFRQDMGRGPLLLTIKVEVYIQKYTESWLFDEVTAAVRCMRTDFFVRHLCPEKKFNDEERVLVDSYAVYIQSLWDLISVLTGEGGSWTEQPRSGVDDTRNGLLEFSQYCNFQNVKLIYFLQNPNVAGFIPTYITCHTNITNVRWHIVNKLFDEWRRNNFSPAVRSTCVTMGLMNLCEW